ncbi:MAG: nucleotidyltransferase domain-containing protein [Firmicutes bacterium]|nr:nucleotidyltransferase domain-containing protein [Bacillota bacterium]
MKYGIPETVLEDIILYAKGNHIKKVLLFGSRARGTNRETSDIDIAVSGGDILNFYFDLEEKANTLLKFDVVDMDKNIEDGFKREIEKDSVVLYEEI